jgi:hypothetical protein
MRHGHNSIPLIYSQVPCKPVPSIYFIDSTNGPVISFVNTSVMFGAKYL